MKQLIQTYLPSACITFTLSVLASAIYNLLLENPYQSQGWLLLLFSYIVVLDLVDYGLSYIDFHTYQAYFITEFIIFYILLLLVGYFGHWFAFTAPSLVAISLMYLVIYCCIHAYFCKLRKYEAEEINQLISSK